MKLVKGETRVVALKRCYSFGERVGIFEVFGSQCVLIKVPMGSQHIPKTIGLLGCMLARLIGC
jgi:hypothetical protein